MGAAIGAAGGGAGDRSRYPVERDRRIPEPISGARYAVVP